VPEHFDEPGAKLRTLDEFLQSERELQSMGEYVYPATKESRWSTLHKRRSEKIKQAVIDYLPDEFGQFPKGLNYLELGAGTGDTAERFIMDLADFKPRVAVVEVNPTMQEILESRSIVSHSLGEVAQESQHVIAAFEVLEHVLDPAAFLKTVLSKLAPGGVFVFQPPTLSPWRYRF